LGLSSLRSGMVCKQRDQPLNPAISVHYWGGYAVRTHQIGLENRVHGAGAREERAQRGAEEDQVLLGRHSRHGCPFTQWSHCRLEVRDWRKVVLSNHNSAKPGAHPSCSFCTLPQRLQSYINHPSAMLRTAVRRFSSAASKQMPTPHPKKHHKKKNHFATAGLPLVLFVVGGYVALTQVTKSDALLQQWLLVGGNHYIVNWCCCSLSAASMRREITGSRVNRSTRSTWKKSTRCVLA